MSDGLQKGLVGWDYIVLSLTSVSRKRTWYQSRHGNDLPSQVHQTDWFSSLLSVMGSHSHAQHETECHNMMQNRLHLVVVVWKYQGKLTQKQPRRVRKCVQLSDGC